MAKRNTAWRVLDHGRAQRLLKAIEESAMAKPAIPLPREQIAAFCRRWHIRELCLFGSVLRDDFRPDSDVDVLVAFLACIRGGRAPTITIEMAGRQGRPDSSGRYRVVRGTLCPRTEGETHDQHAHEIRRRLQHSAIPIH